jgi:cell division inhibitor SepF
MGFMGKIKGILGEEEGVVVQNTTNDDEYYKEALKQNSVSGNKMILLEPRAFSEAQTIADYLKSRNTVVVNLKRVTPEVAKRIVDFLSGAVYAIGGDLQKLGNGIFLCTPNNVDIEGKISSEEKAKNSKKVEEKDDNEFDW